MWIKNQDGNTLVDTCKISYFESDSSPGYEFVCQTNTSLYILGRYSTKEKAMKVMDMIQKQIVYCSESYEIVRPVLKSNPFEPYWKKREVVFQMPKDEEVE